MFPGSHPAFHAAVDNESLGTEVIIAVDSESWYNNFPKVDNIPLHTIIMPIVTRVATSLQGKLELGKKAT